MSKYLDNRGLEHYHNSLQSALVKGVTQAEYDAMTDEQKKGLFVITDRNPGNVSGGDESCSGAGEVYSTEETRIGTYFGKPLYRFCFIVQSLSYTTNIWTPIGPKIENVDWINALYASVSKKGDTPRLRVINDLSAQVAFDADYVKFYSSERWYNGTDLRIVIEYTKTTD